MTHYMLSVYHADGETPPPEILDAVMRDVDALNEELRSAGAWVFAGGLRPSTTATVLRVGDGEALITDGPFAEAKEHIGGLWIIAAPDLDAALEWGRKAAGACRLPVEVRPFQDMPES